MGCVAVFAPNHFSCIPSSLLPARAHDYASVPTPEAGHELTKDGVLSVLLPVAFCERARAHDGGGGDANPVWDRIGRFGRRRWRSTLLAAVGPVARARQALLYSMYI